MQIFLNGEPCETAEGATVASLVASLALEPSRVAVELERVIVRRADWDLTALAPGARVEIVHFVGGG